MRSILTDELSPLELQLCLQSAIAPRPICLASTIDSDGNVNLSPFSFFNLFSTNPPLCIFSPSRRMRDNSTKHTLENLFEIPECVVNLVSYEMAAQTSLASCDFPRGVNEFVKAGFTPLPSLLVKPPRVAGSPVQLECGITQIIPLGQGPGAGNLVLAEIKMIHIREELIQSDGTIDQVKMGLIARMGGDLYCRVTEENVFRLPKPLHHAAIGIDSLPLWIRTCGHFNGNELARLSNAGSLPGEEELENFRKLYPAGSQMRDAMILHAKELLAGNENEAALKVLLCCPAP
ncbi:flavin reductase family protein [Pararcticibacter amylolyticus]|uniref:Flavin reductase n=1 Tax=Pararcticibacter amylolyticus TaxID=2173175 RepID=A0A2U2PFN4_9SPHI|nr:flavin reductase family protein [Pararcticibacter amylolyticus]PWG80218.1 flavin reductase [Pararcticibacter amylolyticus]